MRSKSPSVTTDTDNLNRDLKRRIGLANINQLARELAVSPRTIRRWISEGRFPRPILVSPGGPARWRVGQIEDWLDRQQVRRRRRPAYQGVLKSQMGGQSWHDE
jgi:predicted DNA-binding transcriptional regulator AlpA